MDVARLQHELTTKIGQKDALTLTEANLRRDVTRPGTYQGNHFFDLGDTLLWRSGKMGEACGVDEWITVSKKDGDRATPLGDCPNTGVPAHTIRLVA